MTGCIQSRFSFASHYTPHRLDESETGYSLAVALLYCLPPLHCQRSYEKQATLSAGD
jgi:hypothetical protein